ncbi:hypothetical protein ACTXJO_04745 [Psychrobacter celer]|uniref:hypothetical protein n=1 Tax=Psychrobacter celer TaxID=306572 RepID=UPI003FD141AD
MITTGKIKKHQPSQLLPLFGLIRAIVSGFFLRKNVMMIKTINHKGKPMTMPETPYNDYHSERMIRAVQYSKTAGITIDDRGKICFNNEQYVIPEDHKLMIIREFILVMSYHGYLVTYHNDPEQIIVTHGQFEKTHGQIDQWHIILPRQAILMFTDMTINAIKASHQEHERSRQLAR